MAVEFKDYYEILGVDREATPDEIKKAYRKLARRYHPDNPSVVSLEQAEAKIKEINEAYAVLKDPEKRRKYDRLGADWDKVDESAYAGMGDGPRVRRGPGGAGTSRDFHFSGTGFSDFFEQFFAGGIGGFETDEFGPGRHRSGPGHGGFAERKPTGDDLEADLMISLEEAHRGATRPVTLSWTDPRTGREETRQYKVRIPVGIREGQRLRLSGKGQPGAGGPGDLFLRVRISPHPDYRVEGDDIYYDLELAPWEAVLGTKVEIPTLDGPVRLTVRPGTASGKHLRIRERGLNAKSNKARGDFYAVVRVVLPERVSAEERELWERLAQTSDFKPRD